MAAMEAVEEPFLTISHSRLTFASAVYPSFSATRRIREASRKL